MDKNKFYVNDAGVSISEVKCDFPGCNKYAQTDHMMTLTKRVWGCLVRMKFHTYSCHDHEAVTKEMQDLL